jgi:hypothetical protein
MAWQVNQPFTITGCATLQGFADPVRVLQSTKEVIGEHAVVYHVKRKFVLNQLEIYLLH